MSVLLCVLPLAIAAAPAAFAQAGCQPTLTQPCAQPQQKPADQSSPRPGVKAADEEPIDRSKRIRIDKDTDVNFGLGGVGLGRRF